MNLIPQATTPGLWINTDWQEGTPGTFAVIIGVSNYHHLDGGSGPIAPNTYGLPQLQVSALTAWRFFCWLRDHYRCEQKPLAQCWLLLASSQAELNLEPKMGDHALPPTFGNCEEAIGLWFNAMRQLPDTSAQESRSFFFFSGHGLEMTEDMQLLLPGDYLRPPTYNVNTAMATQNLASGLKALKVPHHFFFLDACRNGNEELAKVASVQGTKILNEYVNSVINPECLVPLLYASAVGSQAWQPDNPTLGISIFGQALLEGLQAEAGMKPDCSRHPQPCVIDLNRLKPFVNNRVNHIMKEQYNAAVGQRIRLRGDQTDELLTEIDVPPPIPAFPPETTLINDAELRAQVYTLQVQAIQWPPKDWSQAHELLGSESMTDIWSNARLYVLPTDNQQGEWLPPNQGFTIRRVERDPNGTTWSIEMFLRRQANHWLELRDGRNVFGCLLPGDNERPRFLFELDLTDRTTETSGLRLLRRVDVKLLPSSDSRPLNQATQLWEKYNSATAAVAADEADAHFLEDVLRGKRRSPLAASIAGLVLLRAGRWDKLHDWLRNLANWFPQLPDGPVLWIEQLMRQPKGAIEEVEPIDLSQPINEAVSYLEMLRTRGLPFTIEAMGYAARQTETFLKFGQLNSQQRANLEELQQRLYTALRYFRSGGMFTVLAGREGEISPALVERWLPDTPTAPPALQPNAI